MEGRRRGGFLHPPASAHRVLDARRGGPDRRRGRGQGGRRRPAGDRHHRPRQHVRDPRLLQGVHARRASSRSSASRPTWPTSPASSGRRAGAGSTTAAATARQGEKLYYHLTLLAENNAGYQNLIKLSSQAFLEGYYNKPRVDWDMLEQLPRGHHRHHRLPGRRRAAGAAAGRLRARRSAHGRPAAGHLRAGQPVRRAPGPRPPRAAQDQPAAARDRPAASAPRCWPPTTATTPIASDAVAHDALLCVQTGSQMDDPNRFKFHGDEHYLKSAAEMRSLFAELPEACDNTLWIAERANVEIEFGKPAAARVPPARRLRRRRRVPPAPDLRGGPGSATATPLPEPRSSSASTTSSASSTTWGSAPTS